MSLLHTPHTRILILVFLVNKLVIIYNHYIKNEQTMIMYGLLFTSEKKKEYFPSHSKKKKK